MTVKKEPFSLDWKGNVLELSKDDRVVKGYDFDKIDPKLDPEFLKLGKKTKLMNFKASAKKLKLDPIKMIDDGYALLCTGAWAFEREGIVKAPRVLILLVAELLEISESDAEVSLLEQKDTWESIATAHAKRYDEIKKELAKAKDAAVPRDLSAILPKK